MLDHLSGGRFEFGTGRGSSSTEFQGFGIPDADTTRDLFDEVTFLARQVRCDIRDDGDVLDVFSGDFQHNNFSLVSVLRD